MKKIKSEDLGKPDIGFAGLKIWINGRQFDNVEDYWDGNWLMVTVNCSSLNSEIWAHGPIIHLSEVEHWLSELKALNKNIRGEAELPCMEPELHVKVLLDKLGNGSLLVYITPDHLTEKHQCRFKIDQSYLPPVIEDLERVLERYPIKRHKQQENRDVFSWR